MNKKDDKKSRISVLREILTEYLRLLNCMPTDISDNFLTMIIYGFIALYFLCVVLAVTLKKFKK